jgi:hypothetical protein
VHIFFHPEYFPDILFNMGAITVASRWNAGRVAKRFWGVVEQGWYLGFTAFGGPPVHFKIVRMDLLMGIMCSQQHLKRYT